MDGAAAITLPPPRRFFILPSADGRETGYGKGRLVGVHAHATFALKKDIKSGRGLDGFDCSYLPSIRELLKVLSWGLTSRLKVTREASAVKKC